MTAVNFRGVRHLTVGGVRAWDYLTPAARMRRYYGTGPGRIPLHLDPADAVMSGTNVASVPNKGGLGAYADATVGVGTITRTGNLFDISASSLTLANPLDLIGVHAFLVVRGTNITGNIGVLGRNIGSNAGQQTSVMWQPGLARMAIDRWDGTAHISASSPISVNITPDLALVELFFSATGIQTWRNRVASAPVNHAYPDFLINNIGRSRFAASFQGQIGDVVSLISDGSAAMAAPVAAIREALSAKYGITLATP